MASFQKSLSNLSLKSGKGPGSDSATDVQSMTSEGSSSGPPPPTAPRPPRRPPPTTAPDIKGSERDSGIEAPSPEGNSSDDDRDKAPARRVRSTATITLGGSGGSASTGSSSSSGVTTTSGRRRPTTNGTARPPPPSAPAPGTPPSFLKKMRDFEVYEGDSARFDVAIQGVPQPEVAWYKEEEVIGASRHYVIDQHENGTCSLIIKNCQEEDDATYSCRVTNPHGTQTCSADLYVETSGLS